MTDSPVPLLYALGLGALMVAAGIWLGHAYPPSWTGDACPEPTLTCGAIPFGLLLVVSGSMLPLGATLATILQMRRTP